MVNVQTDMVSMIEDCRRECHRLVDEQYDALLCRLLLGGQAQCVLEEGERILILAASPERLKGKKPVALILPDGAVVKAHTWKKAVEAILQDCNRDPVRHEQMLELRGRVFGNFRPLLAETPEQMSAPLKIDEGLYWESKFDTEALLRNLTDKLLCRVGYDYQGVAVKYRNPQQEISAPAIEEQASNNGPMLSM